VQDAAQQLQHAKLGGMAQDSTVSAAGNPQDLAGESLDIALHQGKGTLEGVISMYILMYLRLYVCYFQIHKKCKCFSFLSLCQVCCQSTTVMGPTHRLFIATL
jgi:hypothetical protein